MDAQHKLRNPVKQHTPKERLALRRKKRKEGPSGVRRAARRKDLQRKTADGPLMSETLAQAMLRVNKTTENTPLDGAVDRFIADLGDAVLISKAEG